MKYIQHLEIEMTAEELKVCKSVGQNIMDLLSIVTTPKDNYCVNESEDEGEE